MAFWVHYVVPASEADNGLPTPIGDEIVGFAQTVEVDSGERIIEFAIVAVGDGYQIATDIDCTALLRGQAEELAAAQAVDAWVLESARRAVRIHELLLDRWYEACSASHRSSIDSLERWLRAHDPSGDYWASLARGTTPRSRT